MASAWRVSSDPSDVHHLRDGREPRERGHPRRRSVRRRNRRGHGTRRGRNHVETAAPAARDRDRAHGPAPAPLGEIPRRHPARRGALGVAFSASSASIPERAQRRDLLHQARGRQTSARVCSPFTSGRWTGSPRRWSSQSLAALRRHEVIERALAPGALPRHHLLEGLVLLAERHHAQPHRKIAQPGPRPRHRCLVHRRTTVGDEDDLRLREVGIVGSRCLHLRQARE